MMITPTTNLRVHRLVWACLTRRKARNHIPVQTRPRKARCPLTKGLCQVRALEGRACHRQ